jgi:hypothetical protein
MNVEFNKKINKYMGGYIFIKNFIVYLCILLFIKKTLEYFNMIFIRAIYRYMYLC